MTNERMSRCSTSVIRKMQIKVMIQHHSPPTKMTEQGTDCTKKFTSVREKRILNTLLVAV